MDVVFKLFGNEPRIKLMRFLFLNEIKFYSFSELEKRTGISGRTLGKEIESLRKIGLVKVKKTKTPALRGAKKKRKNTALMAALNTEFKYGHAFKDLFVATNPLSGDAILKRLNQTGKIKLIVASGIFMENPDSRLDLMVVGDRFDKASIDRAMRSFETTLGRELRYALLETNDFNYRLSIFDRLVRDVLDYPHRKILNKIGL